jgi:ornithine cyclodeaminase
VDVGEGRVAELGQVLAGTRAGRTRDDQVTVCDLTGTGVQDTAIARLAVSRAAGDR